MKKNLKALAIIFSVVLNIVVVGSYFYHESCLFPAGSHQGNHNRFLYEELDLSHDQLERFEPLGDRFHAFVGKQGQKIKAEQIELIGLLAVDRPDQEAIGAKQEEIQALQRQMQAKVIDHLLEESRLFTPEQREKFFALIRDRIEKSSLPGPRWMPQKQESPSKGKCP